MGMVVACAGYENGVRIADLSIQQSGAFARGEGRFVWIGLHEPSVEILSSLQQQFGLHDLAVEDAFRAHQRPKIEDYGNSLFVVMHLLDLADDGINVGEVHISVGRNYVLSLRNRSRQHFLAVRERCEREPQLLKQGAGFVLYALMDATVDRYFPVAERFETELEEIEAQIFVKGTARANIKRLYELKTRVLQLKHAVAPLLEETGKLFGGRAPAVCASSREYFRDVFDHLTRINTSIDNVRETIGTAIQVNLSMVAIEESEDNKKLAAWAGIFAVATAFAGIWGMNFKAMPELDWVYGYPVALAVIAATSVFLYLRFKRAGWL